MTKLLLILLAASAAFAADDPWGKVCDLNAITCDSSRSICQRDSERIVGRSRDIRLVHLQIQKDGCLGRVRERSLNDIA